MARTLVIKLDPHELLPTYSAGCTDYSIALTTSVDSASADAADPVVAKQYLTPWRWEAIQAFQVWNLSTPVGQPVDQINTAVTVSPTPAGTPDLSKFLNTLDGTLPDPTPGDLFYDDKNTSGDPEQCFATKLASLQGVGASTPQWLKLVSFARVKTADLPPLPPPVGQQPRKIALVPVIEVPGLAAGQSVVLTPDTVSARTTKPKNDGGAAATFNYLQSPANALPFIVRGEIQLDPPWQPDPGALIDPNNLLVFASGHPNNFGLYSDDWLSGLAARVAEGADLLNLVVAWAEKFLSLDPITIPTPCIITPNPTHGGLYTVRLAFLAACRSVAHAGAKAEAGQAAPPKLLTDPPDPASLADDLIAAVNPSGNPNARHGLVRALREQDANSDSIYSANWDLWRNKFNCLLGNLPGKPAWLNGALVAPSQTDQRLTRDEIDQELLGMRAISTALWRADIASTVITKQWEGVTDPTTNAVIDPTIISSALAAAQSRDRGLRRQLTLGSFGPDLWTKLLTPATGVTDPVAISQAFPEVVADYAKGALGGALPNAQFTSFVTDRAIAYASLATTPTSPPPAVGQTAKNSLLGFNPTRKGNCEYGDGTPTQQSGGLVYAFDRVGPENGAADFLNRLAGVVVFLKQGNASAIGHTLQDLASPANLQGCFGSWRALNIADLYLKYSTTDPAIIERAILPAVRFTTDGGVRHALITYNAHPLIARSPAAKLVGDVNATPPPKGLSRGPIDTEYHAPKKPNGQYEDWARLPELRFGQVYALQAFARTHAGALPSELVAPGGHPAYLKPWSETVDIGTVSTDGTVLARVARYLRRVAVGAPVWQAAPGDPRYGKASPLPAPTLPPIPSGVTPLAPEVPPWSGGGSFDLPLLLLQPNWKALSRPEQHPPPPDTMAPTSFTFQLRMPTVDLETWDHWVATGAVRHTSAAAVAQKAGNAAAADAATKAAKAVQDQRIKVRAEYYTNLSLRKSKQPAASIDIDDPAVTGVLVKVIDRSPGGADAAPPATTLTLPITTLPACAGTGLAGVRRPPIAVTVTVATGAWGVQPYDTANNALEICVPKGHVIEVDISVLVPASEFFTGVTATPPARMIAISDFGYAPLDTDRSLICCGMMRFVVEVATNTLPDAGALRDALVPSIAGDQLRVAFNTLPTAPFAYCQWAEPMRQIWRWDGRALADFPWPKLTPANTLAFDPLDATDGIGTDACANWEVRGFGSRADTDYSQQRVRLIYNQARSANEVPVLYQESIEGDRRALYNRFAVRVISRYQGVIPLDASDTLNHLGRSSLEAAKSNELAAWQRLVVRPRWSQALPRPNLRCLLPLSKAGAHGKTNLLAVFDETWYDMAGFAEIARAKVAAAAPISDAQPPDASPMTEIGYDPIVSARAWERGDDIVFAASGGIGFTSDTDSDAPLFNTTAFLISSSVPLDAWTFVKLSFARDIAAGASAITMSPATDADDEAWTPGHWVQILPDSGQFDCGTPEAPALIAASDLRLMLTPATPPESGTSLSFTDASDTPVVLLPTQLKTSDAAKAATGFVTFEFWLVVTVGIRSTGFETDENGFAGEAYILTVKLDGASALLPAKYARATGPIFARVVEVQRRIGAPPQPSDGSPPPDDPLWLELFPDEKGGLLEPAMRIVRVSDPIGENGPKWNQGKPTNPAALGV